MDSSTKVPIAAHKVVSGLQTALVKDTSTKVDGDYIANLYQGKKIPTQFIEIAGAGFYYLGSDPTGIAAELGIPKLEGNFPLVTRILSSSYKVNGKTAGYRYRMTAEPLISAEFISQRSDVSMTDPDFFDKVMNSKAVANLKAKAKYSKAETVNDAFNNRINLVF